MIRIGAGALVCAIAACATTAPPPAAPGYVTTPRMPLGTDLDAVPVGSWAEYSETSSGFTNTNRVAVVAKTSETITIESTLTGGLWHSDQVTLAPTLGLGSRRGRLLRGVTQVNSRAPEDWDLTKSAPSWYPALDPKALVGTEAITVRAGTFTTRHYRYATRYGDPIDAWIDEAVWPIGLVRLEAKVALRPAALAPGGVPPPSPGRATFVFELIARGDDAKPRITLPAKPHDPPK